MVGPDRLQRRRLVPPGDKALDTYEGILPGFSLSLGCTAGYHSFYPQPAVSGETVVYSPVAYTNSTLFQCTHPDTLPPTTTSSDCLTAVPRNDGRGTVSIRVVANKYPQPSVFNSSFWSQFVASK